MKNLRQDLEARLRARKNLREALEALPAPSLEERARWVREGLECRTPCCDRKTRKLPFMLSATLIMKRTCPKCGSRWTVKVIPAEFLGGRGVVHRIEWRGNRTDKLWSTDVALR